MRKLIFSLFIAAILWFFMFSSPTKSLLNFWWCMTVSALILSSLAFPHIYINRQCFSLKKQFVIGIIIALGLWGIFWLGDFISSQIFDFARPQVESIYQMKDGNKAWFIGILLLFIIGPAEEFFWRGYIQSQLSQRLGANKSFVFTTSIYTLIHLPSLNFMLIMSALICGICWGGLYRLNPKSLPAIVISHALWDAAVFVWFPI